MRWKEEVLRRGPAPTNALAALPARPVFHHDIQIVTRLHEISPAFPLSIQVLQQLAILASHHHHQGSFFHLTSETGYRAASLHATPNPPSLFLINTLLVLVVT